MKVGIFYSSITNLVKAPHKAALMDVFRDGVLACGDQAILYTDNSLPDSTLDAGFVLGYSIGNNHRRKIIDTLVRNGAYPIFVDSNILNYAKSEHQWHRYSMNSVYPNNGIYFFGNSNPNKWQEFSSWHGASLKPWRTQGNHILLLCQRPKGWNMFAPSQDTWIDETIAKIKQHTQRPIRIRMHPGDGNRQAMIDKIQKQYNNTVTLSDASNIREDLVNCWAAVGYNSTPNVVSAIEGVPVYIEDPLHSWASDIAFQDLSCIESPPLPDRAAWATKIANIHWSNSEVQQGKLWSAMRDYISSVR